MRLFDCNFDCVWPLQKQWSGICGRFALSFWVSLSYQFSTRNCNGWHKKRKTFTSATITSFVRRVRKAPFFRSLRDVLIRYDCGLKLCWHFLSYLLREKEEEETEKWLSTAKHDFSSLGRKTNETNLAKRLKQLFARLALPSQKLKTLQMH